MSAPARILPALVRRYAEDAAFQWLLRDRAAHSPNHAAADMADLDERLEAFLDGLRLAGPAGREIWLEELAWREPGEAFVAGVLAFESGDADLIGQAAGAAADPALARALVSALGWLPWETAGARAAAFAKEDPVLRYAAVGGAAVHRRWLPDLMAAALADAHPDVRARAYKACGELGRKELLPALAAGLESEDIPCRFWAAWSSALLDPASASRLSPWAKQPGPYRDTALKLFLRAAPFPEALAFLDALDKADIRARIDGFGWAGAAERVPWLLERMREPAHARAAAAAMAWITGADFRPGGLGLIPPAEVEEGLEEAGLADVRDRDHDWPDPEAATAWWQKTAKQYAPGKAYAFGSPKSQAGFEAALSAGMQHHRLGAALELALAGPGKPLASCLAPSFRRRRTSAVA